MTTEERLTALETNVEYIKAQVSNHLPTQISVIGDKVDVLMRQRIRIEAVSQFLSAALQICALVIGVAWTVKQLFFQ